MTDVVYTRAKHAAHYHGLATGHDLETWTFAGPVNVRHPEIPAGAEYHHGFLRDGVQHWVYARRAPFSPGRCSSPLCCAQDEALLAPPPASALPCEPTAPEPNPPGAVGSASSNESDRVGPLAQEQRDLTGRPNAGPRYETSVTAGETAPSGFADPLASWRSEDVQDYATRRQREIAERKARA